MATIRRRETRDGKARWEVQVRVHGYPAETSTFSKPGEARAWAAERETDLRSRRRTGRPARQGEQTLAEAIDRWLVERAGSLAPSERPGRERILRRWRAHAGHLALRDIQPDRIVAALAGLEQAGRSPATLNRYLSALSAVLKVAEREWQWISENPARRVTRRRESAGRVRYLSPAEVERLLDACRVSRCGSLYALAALAIYTGARQGELLSLRWEDVSLDRRTATLWQTKNRESRTIPLSTPALAVLRDLGARPTGSVLSLDVHPKQAWRHAIARAGLEPLRFHDLRHTAASWFAMSGASLLDIAAILGHKTLAMVRRYSHLAPSHLADVADRMAAFLESKGRSEPEATD